MPNGEVKGKYGYTDETGKLRVVEYGANRYGFQPAGEGITVAPPTLVDETTNKDGTLNEYADNGNYYNQCFIHIFIQVSLTIFFMINIFLFPFKF